MLKLPSKARAAGRYQMKSRVIRFVLALTVVLPSLPALAQRYEQERHWHGDIARFHEHDVEMWRRGRWVHGEHDARHGWWWVVGGIWYYYPTPVYPFPDPYQPPDTIAAAPPAVLVAPTPKTWYYCEAANGYYPYVPSCQGGWKQIQANPLPAGQATSSR